MKEPFLCADLTTWSFHDYTHPPSQPSLLMSGQADRLWLQAQVNNLKKNRRWKSGSSSPDVETHAHTIVLLTPTWINAPLGAINWKMWNVWCCQVTRALTYLQQWKWVSLLNLCVMSNKINTKLTKPPYVCSSIFVWTKELFYNSILFPKP